MAKGFKSGGRQKGTMNKPGQQAAEILRSLNCDPIEGMVRIAMDTNNSPELRGRMFSDLARYIYPQRKAVELSGTDGADLKITVTRADR
jgi:hypothetical protein